MNRVRGEGGRFNSGNGYDENGGEEEISSLGGGAQTQPQIKQENTSGLGGGGVSVAEMVSHFNYRLNCLLYIDWDSLFNYLLIRPIY